MIRKIFLTASGQWRISSVMLLALAIMIFGFIPLMGLPGALVVVTSDLFISTTVGKVFGYRGIVDLPLGDNAWGLMIYATWLWPVSIVAGYVLGFRLLRKKRTLVRWLAFLAVMALWAIVVTLYLHHVALADLEYLKENTGAIY